MSERAARDQLADVIVQVLDPDALDPVQQEVALAVADAVLGMIKPLEWENFDACTWWARTHLFTYRINERTGIWITTRSAAGHNKRNSLTNQSADYIVYEIDDLETAKAAADADNVEQILAALGLDAGEGQL